jgi:hypothetical protein
MVRAEHVLSQGQRLVICPLRRRHVTLLFEEIAERVERLGDVATSGAEQPAPHVEHALRVRLCGGEMPLPRERSHPLHGGEGPLDGEPIRLTEISERFQMGDLQAAIDRLPAVGAISLGPQGRSPA